MDDRLLLVDPPVPELVLELLEKIREGLDFDDVVDALIQVVPPETVEPRHAFGADPHFVRTRSR